MLGRCCGSVLSIAVLALVVTACGGHDDAAPTTSPPPPQAIGTATPDLRSAVSPREAMQRLLTVPNIGMVLRALADADVDGLLELIDWQPQGCGYRATDLCPEDVAEGTEFPMVNVGWPVRFWVTADTLRPVLTRLLAGESLHLGFASRVPPAQARLGPIYYVGLEGPVKGEGLAAIEGFRQSLTGMFLTIDGGADRPVLEFAWLVETWSATQHATELADVLRLEEQEVITFNP